MVVFYLRNSLAPDDKVVPITIALTLDSVVPYEDEEFPDLSVPEGDRIWLLIVAPPRDELDKDTGLPIPPEIINIVSEDTVHTEIEAAMGRIGERVEWPPLLADIQPPQLSSIEPLQDATDVNIFSNIIYRITEPLPAAGLDLSTLNITLDNLPIVTSGVTAPGEDVELRGNVFDLTIIHRPKRSFS
jgi:hypothetical protein